MMSDKTQPTRQERELAAIIDEEIHEGTVGRGSALYRAARRILASLTASVPREWGEHKRWCDYRPNRGETYDCNCGAAERRSASSTDPRAEERERTIEELRRLYGLMDHLQPVPRNALVQAKLAGYAQAIADLEGRALTPTTLRERYCGCPDCQAVRWPNPFTREAVPHNVRYPWPVFHSADCALSNGYDLGSEENNCTCGAVQERARRAASATPGPS